MLHRYPLHIGFTTEFENDLTCVRLCCTPFFVFAKCRPDGWTDYMGAIFQYLHQNNVTQEQILDCMKEIPFVKGKFAT